MVHLEHVQFDPCGRSSGVVVDASMHGLYLRGARCNLGRGEWRDDPLHVLPGASTCYPFFAPSVPLAFWACRVTLAVLARPKGQSVLCNVGVCHESAVDDAKALCQNSRSLCVVLMKRGTDIVRKFWDGWSQELFYSVSAGDTVLSLKERSHVVFQLGFLLNLARRCLVVVDPGKDEILQEFTLPEEEVVWLPCASLHQQDKVESSVCWLRPDRLPDCLVPQLTPY